MTLYYPPTQNGLQKTLDATLSQGVTASLTLNNVTGIQNKPGVVLINRIDSGGSEQSASDREWVAYTAVSGSTLTGLTRGVGGSSDQDHANGQVVEFIPDITWAQGIIDTIVAEHGTDGTHSADAIDTITEIAAGLKSGSDTTLVTGTAGTDGYTAKWNADGDLVDGYEVLDEDTMSSDSATKLATQQSIKAYVDANAGVTEGCRLYKSANQSIANNSYTNITWDSESWDTDTMHDNVTNNSRITFTTAGKYQINVQVRWSDISATGYVGLRGIINATTTVIDTYQECDNRDSYDIIRYSDIINVNASDYLILSIFQNSGGSRNVYGGLTHSTYVSVHRLS